MNTKEDFQAGKLTVHVFDNAQELGRAAARDGGAILEQRIRENGHARILVATGNSQLETAQALIGLPNIDWSAVEVFHVDEYAGLPVTHPASFRRWIRTRVVERVHPRAANYLNGEADDLDAECRRYAALLSAEPIDVAFIGIGENGHIGFNDPHEADFDDPLLVRRVTLDHKCRLQQVGEGHFPDLSSVPAEALTMTCPALVSARAIICSVPDRRKAEAVRNTLEGPISPACPASILRTHQHCGLYLDRDAASLTISHGRA